MTVLNQYLEFTRNSESPTIFHRWSFLSCMAAALGRRVYIQHGSKTVYPTMFVILVGSPGARKNAAQKAVAAILRRSGYIRFAPDETSPEQFIRDLGDGFGNTSKNLSAAELLAQPNIGFADSEGFIMQEELIQFLGVNNVTFAKLLLKLWDTPEEFSISLRDGKKRTIKAPTVNMLSAATPANLNRCLPPESNAMGLNSRLLLIYGEPTATRITFPRIPTVEETECFTEFFSNLQKFSGEMRFTAEGARFLDTIYQAWENLEDSRLIYYGARRLEHLMKLCLIIAALHSTLEISDEIILEANSILTAAEEHMGMALGEYGSSTLAVVAQAILQVLENVGKPLSLQDLHTAVARDVSRYADFLVVISNLQRTKKITVNKNEMVILQRAGRTDRRAFTDYATYVPEALAGELL